jgi:hypothetical protein
MLLWAIVGIVLICVVLLDAFETIVLPRRATRRLRLARLVLWSTWQLWSAPARGHWHSGDRRETYLSFYGPFALLLLIGVWSTGLIGGFALLLWGLDAQMAATGGDAGFGTALYGSGTTFFTLGIGDVLPHTALGRLLVVLEAGLGFAFLALIISYIPVLTQAFSQREVNVSLLDARAGSPPSAAELLRRHAGADFTGALAQVVQGGGALVGRAAGKSPLVSDPGLLSLPAPRAVLARRAHYPARCRGPAPGGDRRRADAAGPAGVRHGAPCRR